MRAGVRLVGVDRAREQLGAATRNLVAAFRVGVAAVAEEVLDDAVERAPQRTGRLRSSAYEERRGDTVEIGFSAPYAAEVHEIPEHHEVGESKFLQRAVPAAAGSMTERIGTETQRAAESGASSAPPRYPSRGGT